MKNSKEVLVQRFYNYLIYDQVGRTEFINPFSSNSEQHERIMKDAERMAELAINEINK
jgi:hypothetical protein